MIGIVRIYHDAYGPNMGARTFCQLSKYFGGVLITDNKKIQQLDFKQITHQEALNNIKKFTKIIVYNTKPNMFGGVAPKHTAAVVRLINAIPDVYYYNCDPILDLPKGVADSHEAQVPGLSKAIHKLNNFGTHLSRKNTDLTSFLAAQIQQPLIKPGTIEKHWLGCYFGDARQPERQKQVFELLDKLETKLIIGHEHDKFPWFDYTPDFYNLLSTAWTTPIIGDQKLHYETGIPSIRLYEAWHTNTVALVDSRFRVPNLPDDFFFSTVEQYHEKTKLIATHPELYHRLIKIQHKRIRKLTRRYANTTFDWGAIRTAKSKVKSERKYFVRKLKREKLELAKNRLIKNKIINPNVRTFI